MVHHGAWCSIRFQSLYLRQISQSFINPNYERWFLDWARGASTTIQHFLICIQLIGTFLNLTFMSVAIFWLTKVAAADSSVSCNRDIYLAISYFLREKAIVFSFPIFILTFSIECFSYNLIASFAGCMFRNLLHTTMFTLLQSLLCWIWDSFCHSFYTEQLKLFTLRIDSQFLLR